MDDDRIATLAKEVIDIQRIYFFEKRSQRSDRQRSLQEFIEKEFKATKYED
jgi:hypothetical protein